MAHPSVWYVDPDMTISIAYGGTPVPTPDGALKSLGHFITRLSDRLRDAGRAEGLVLVDDQAVKALGLDEPAAENGYQAARATLERIGWKMTASGLWMTFYGYGNHPTVHLGRFDALERAGWPFEQVSIAQTVGAIEEWVKLTGYGWYQDPPAMGRELIARTLRPFRLSNVKGNQPVVRHDEHTPSSAVVSMWTPQAWTRPRQPGKWLHAYDRYRAGITACSTAKCAVERLSNGYRKFDGKRAGWWQITRPAWNMPEMPHPCGPGKPGAIQWVTTAQLDLVAELNDQGLIKFPDIIESWTGLARPVLQPFSQMMERTYQLGSDFIREIVKEVGNAGIGMIGNPDSKSLYRYDWFASVNATKQANAWRIGFRCGNNDKAFPVAYDDDKLWFTSDEPDPVKAAPATIARPFTDRDPWQDAPGYYRPEGTRPNQKG